jgi:hypothetical protein
MVPFVLGNAELIKEMTSYKTDNKVFIIKPFCCSGGSCIVVSCVTIQAEGCFNAKTVP